MSGDLNLVVFRVERAQMSIRKKLFLVTAAIMAAALPSVAQTDRATLEGTVTDPSASTISGARVKIAAVETGLTQERTTNSNGQYRFPGIVIGQYTVSVSNSTAFCPLYSASCPLSPFFSCFCALFALSCKRAKLNSFPFMGFRTLYQK